MAMPHEDMGGFAFGTGHNRSSTVAKKDDFDIDFDISGRNKRDNNNNAFSK